MKFHTIGELSDYSVQALLAADTTVRAWAAQIDRIAAIFGDDKVGELREQNRIAAEQLTRVFGVRSEVEATPDAPVAEHAAQLDDIVRTCEAIKTHYSQQAPALAAWWELTAQAPTLLAALPAEIERTAGRLATAEQRVAVMAADFPGPATAPLQEDIADAEQQLAAVRATVHEMSAVFDTADTALALQVRTAQDQLAAIDAVVVHIDQVEADIANAQQQWPQLAETVAAGVSEAESSLGRRSAGAWEAELAGRLRNIHIELAAARSAGSADPVAATATLRPLVGELRKVQSEIAAAQSAAGRAHTMLRQELISARATVTAAANFVTTHGRDANEVAREAVDGAQQAIAEAELVAVSEPDRARELARSAVSLVKSIR